ncbi:peptidyl-prolyl cis-trans isomerase [Micromonospora pattaloongensis]|uniref:peptidylprolyl isomerase n=1 Tax=Micromonospora pattaloongensis TaxID=405436 RepID=UPI0015875400|nr:peptidylprolyl isomerase [Micromonospora pattaloongensis]
MRALMVDRPLPAVLIPGRYAGPWTEALERAIRDELLVREAARRGIDAPTRAQQIAELIRREQRDGHGLTADDITDGEARAWYEQNRALFGKVEQADVAWAEFTNGPQARKLLESVTGTDQTTFLRLVREADAAHNGTATIDHKAEGADPMIARAAFAVGTAGGVGLAPDPANNRWWLVRVERISFERVTWDAEVTYQVKSALAAHRQEEHLRRLTDSLRKQWPVDVNETRIADMVKRES